MKISMEIPDSGFYRKDINSVLGMVLLARERLYQVRNRIEVIQIRFDGGFPYNAVFTAVLTDPASKENGKAQCRYNSKNYFTSWKREGEMWSFISEDEEPGAEALCSAIAAEIDSMARALDAKAKQSILDAERALGAIAKLEAERAKVAIAKLDAERERQATIKTGN